MYKIIGLKDQLLANLLRPRRHVWWTLSNIIFSSWVRVLRSKWGCPFLKFLHLPLLLCRTLITLVLSFSGSGGEVYVRSSVSETLIRPWADVTVKGCWHCSLVYPLELIQASAETSEHLGLKALHFALRSISSGPVLGLVPSRILSHARTGLGPSGRGWAWRCPWLGQSSSRGNIQVHA